ncbi:hypothetical protein QBC44DRAFT_371934 [Cladorrhinum sp. PSN332]|nr:hypothetical protein QBC44DRAFT_371934 [Cladorrhinum sp. PSN332]
MSQSYDPLSAQKSGSALIQDYLAIGIDFGTTYSGVSWASSKSWARSQWNPFQVKDILNWPSGDYLFEEAQVPTLLNPKTGEWGFQVFPQSDPLRWFKLLLVDEADLDDDLKKSEQLKESRTRAEAFPGGVDQLISNFLGKLWNHTLEELGETHVPLSLPLKVAITVPAIWKPYAKERMKRAAIRAGITRPREVGNVTYPTTLCLVEEPEAAALWTLREYNDSVKLEVGETFIVCDCGGGTVDIITYQVTSNEPFTVKEAVKGDGRLCGGFLIDQAFENHINSPAVRFKFGKCHPEEFREFVNTEWERTLKRRFRATSGSRYLLRPPFTAISKWERWWPAPGGKGPKFSLDNGVIQRFFSDSRVGILLLIGEQYKRLGAKNLEPTNILFVGGLGDSRYLYSELNLLYPNLRQTGCSWSAVARGAVITVLEGGKAIDSRVARLSYGVQVQGYSHRVLLASTDDESDSQNHSDLEEERHARRMIWYLREGEAVDNRAPVTYNFRMDIGKQEKAEVKMAIYVSDENPPPAHVNRSVQKLCDLQCPLSIPWHHLPTARGPRGRVSGRLADVQLTMKFEGRPKWTLSVGHIGDTIEEDVNILYGN